MPFIVGDAVDWADTPIRLFLFQGGSKSRQAEDVYHPQRRPNPDTRTSRSDSSERKARMVTFILGVILHALI